jgi:alanyl-tRNA synthetase
MEGKKMTEKLYYSDVFCRSFTAQVSDCQPAGDRWAVVLDRTAFYPEGGGQPWDTGVLGGQAVTEVQERDGDIVHYLNGPLETGAVVTGEIDWARRFDLMQQHSGEHMVSGLAHAAFGCDNVGFHMGADVITIDLSCVLTMEQLQTVEDEANRLIWEDREVEIFWPTAEELKTLPYRSKKELTGAVRLVRFPDADLCACCGTHVARTGQIGLVKILSCVKFRSGVRVEMVCGQRAVEHLSAMWAQNHKVSGLLSAKAGETAAAVERLLAENGDLKYRYAALEDQLFTQQAEALAGQGNVVHFASGLTPDGVRRLAVAIMARCGGVAAVFSGDDETGYKYCIGQENGDVRQLTKDLNAACNGRGGGKPFFTQGSVQSTKAEIKAFFAKEMQHA